MRAAKGDRVVIKPHGLGEPERDAEILEVLGADGRPPYRIRWGDDGREMLFFPGADAVVQHFPANGNAARTELGRHNGEVLMPSTDTLLPCAVIAARLRAPYKDLAGVERVELWRKHTEAADVLWLAPGAVIPPHRHGFATHHVWVAQGVAVVDGHVLQAGSYYHVPAGRNYGVVASEESGCVLFCVYRQAVDV
jgi:hypothetical protein